MHVTCSTNYMYPNFCEDDQAPYYNLVFSAVSIYSITRVDNYLLLSIIIYYCVLLRFVLFWELF